MCRLKPIFKPTYLSILFALRQIQKSSCRSHLNSHFQSSLHWDSRRFPLIHTKRESTFNPLCIETFWPLHRLLCHSALSILFALRHRWTAGMSRTGWGLSILFALRQPLLCLLYPLHVLIFQSSLHWDCMHEHNRITWSLNFQSSLHWDYMM